MIDLIAGLKARFIAPRFLWQTTSVGTYQYGMYRLRDFGEGFCSVFVCGHYVATFASVAKAKRYCEKDHHAMNRLASTAKVHRRDR